MTIRYSTAAREALGYLPDGGRTRIERSRLFGHPARPETWIVLSPDQARFAEDRPDELAALAPYRLDPEREGQ